MICYVLLSILFLNLCCKVTISFKLAYIVPPDLYRSARKIFTEGNEIFRRYGINPYDPVRTGQVVRSSSLKAKDGVHQTDVIRRDDPVRTGQVVAQSVAHSGGLRHIVLAMRGVPKGVAYRCCGCLFFYAN